MTFGGEIVFTLLLVFGVVLTARVLILYAGRIREEMYWDEFYRAHSRSQLTANDLRIRSRSRYC